MDNFDLRKYLTENKLTSNSKLDEIGDASAEPYKWKAHPKSKLFKSHQYIYTFRTEKGTEYEAEFTYSAPEAEKGNTLYGFDFFTNVEPEEYGDSEVTNEGVPLRVMSTIVQIIKDFITKNPTASIEYFADTNFKGDARRAKLYMAYIKKLIPSNYEVIDKGRDVLIKPKDGE